jgi:hypothetical protein
VELVAACGDGSKVRRHGTDGEALTGHGGQQSERVRGRGRERGRATRRRLLWWQCSRARWWWRWVAQGWPSRMEPKTTELGASIHGRRKPREREVGVRKQSRGSVRTLSFDLHMSAIVGGRAARVARGLCAAPMRRSCSLAKTSRAAQHALTCDRVRSRRWPR